MPDRIQQEIEELLAKLETFPPKKSFPARVRDGISGFLRGIGDALSSIPWPRLSAGHLLLVAIAAIVIFYLLEPGGADVTRWVIAGAFVLFIAAFVMSLRRNSPGGRPTEKLWRGKPMDLHGPGVGDRLRSWWRRRSRH
jgi:hypothetical protein